MNEFNLPDPSCPYPGGTIKGGADEAQGRARGLSWATHRREEEMQSSHQHFTCFNDKTVYIWKKSVDCWLLLWIQLVQKLVIKVSIRAHWSRKPSPRLVLQLVGSGKHQRLLWLSVGQGRLLCGLLFLGHALHHKCHPLRTSATLISSSACRCAATEISVSQSETGDLNTAEMCLTYLKFCFFSGTPRVVDGAAANHGTFYTVGDSGGGKGGGEASRAWLTNRRNPGALSLSSPREISAKKCW